MLLPSLDSAFLSTGFTGVQHHMHLLWTHQLLPAGSVVVDSLKQPSTPADIITELYFTIQEFTRVLPLEPT